MLRIFEELKTYHDEFTKAPSLILGLDTSAMAGKKNRRNEVKSSRALYDGENERKQPLIGTGTPLLHDQNSVAVLLIAIIHSTT